MRNDAMGFFWEDLPPAAREKVEKAKRTPPEPTWLRPDYLPGIEEARSAQYDYMTEGEIVTTWMTQENVFFDIECYSNYFLASFVSESGKVLCFEQDEFRQLDAAKFRWVLEHFQTIGFNSLSYDLTISNLAMEGLDCAALKEASDELILQGVPPWMLLRKHKVKAARVNHIDLIEVAPLRANLKIYGGRLHTKRMQDLPFHPDTRLTQDQKLCVKLYNVRADLASTQLLYKALEKELELRVTMSNQYKVDLRSKSDAQIAEAVIAKEYEKRTGIVPTKPVIPAGTSYKYNVPNFIQYQTPQMQRVLEIIRAADFAVEDTGSIGMSAEIKDLSIKIGDSVYRMGIGGLHSSEKRAYHVSDSEYQLFDKDVTSYYPFIILNLGLYPHHLGPVFLDIFRNIVNRRVDAKHAGDKVVAATLKIVINGSFGKLGSMFSILYSPDLLIQVTITGQLSLLLLIEALEMNGIHVVSANTDGIAIKCPRNRIDLMNRIIEWWQQATGFNMEETRYLALFSRDVNNYIAVKEKMAKDGTPLGIPGGVKCKGAYANPWTGELDATRLHKNPTNTICIDAVQQYITSGRSIEDTIRSCTDITKFVSVRTVKGGAVKVWEREAPPAHASEEELVQMAGYSRFSSDAYVVTDKDQKRVLSLNNAYDCAVDKLSPPAKMDYLGKSIRWYYAKELGGEVVYATSGNRVPKSDNAMPILDLPDQFPTNVDYDWYIAEAKGILNDVGCEM